MTNATTEKPRKNYYTGRPPKRTRADGTPRARTAVLARRAIERERVNLTDTIMESLDACLIAMLKRRALNASDEVKAAYQTVLADLAE